MRALAIYGSSRGNTKLVASRLIEHVTFPVDVVNAADVIDAATWDSYDLFIFLASTWGDGELQVDMEALFLRLKPSLAGKRYALCELGNYYGYDDFEFGALRIMQHFATETNAIELVEPFCMDSLPKKDWAGFERWCAALNVATSIAK